MNVMLNKIIIFLFIANVSVFSANYRMLTDLGTSARMIGRGNIEGFSESSNAVFENPASLYRIENASFSAFTTTIMNEVTYTNITLASRTPFGVFAVGYMEASVSDIPHTGENIDPNKTFFPEYLFDLKNTIIKGTYQFSLNKQVSFGASAVQYGNNFDSVSGIGYNMDLGTAIDFGAIEVSVFARNILGTLDVNYTKNEEGEEKSEALAAQGIASIKAGFKHFDAMVQAKYKEKQLLPSLGFVYRPDFLSILELSAGYKTFLILDDASHNVTMGAGLRLPYVSFYYAFEKSDHIQYDNKHYFSASFTF